MHSNHATTAALLLAAFAIARPATHAADLEDVDTIPELVVTSQRRDEPLITHAGNVARIDAAALQRIGHQHLHELMTRVPGVWITRASGQEHLTAIRSPTLSGAGSCGAFLFLEDGIPARPAGLCNVNALFEIGTEQARSVEIIRGPGNALYGSNALHGTINVIMPEPGRGYTPGVAIEAGSNDYYRLRADVPFDRDAHWLASLVLADDRGFRDDSGYRQTKVHAKRRWDVSDGEFTLGLSATDLDQETAGYVFGRGAYANPALNRANLNPEAFRAASSQRLYGLWKRSQAIADFDVRPYLRHSEMRFLQHFLPGQPLEENGQFSAGVVAMAAFDRPERSTIVGVDLEIADIYLRQTQFGPTEGSPFLVETRPDGKQYDYRVRSVGAAAYVQFERRLSTRLVLAAGLRAEHLRYDYDNRMLTGNTRDDGTECGFGGCLYTRPADRADSYTNLAPKLSLSYRLGRHSAFYASLAQGFRAPQATELYRLQSGQQIAELDSEQIDSLEAGIRGSGKRLDFDITAFAAHKRDSIFRDAEGFNVDGGRSLHRGIEAMLEWRLAASWALAVDATLARHTYGFDSAAAQGEVFVAGRDVDTAPRLLGSVELLYAQGSFDAGLQWTTIGEYYLDAENRFRYPGHSILNLRAGFELGRGFGLVMRINNLGDRMIADRADYAFGEYRYFPGRGREFFAEFNYSP